MKSLIDESADRDNFGQDSDPQVLYLQSAELHGDTQIKADAARLKRITSALRNNLSLLHRVPNSLHVDMGKLLVKLEDYTSDLMNIVDWASEVHAQAQRERNKVAREQLECFAQERWGTDIERRDTEIAVLKELQTSSGMQAMGEWFHSHGLLQDIPATNFSSPFSTFTVFSPGDEVLNACLCLIKASTTVGHRIKGFNTAWYRIGYSEYDNYMQHQLESKASSLKLIQLISGL
jgi:hypothetical protein